MIPVKGEQLEWQIGEICTTVQVNTLLAVVTELPATGETPFWRTPLLLMLALGGLLIFGGTGAVLWRRVW